MLRSTFGIVLAVACVLIGARDAGQAQSHQSQTSTQKPEQRPVFRTGTHFVQVDAYPRRDGQIVENLKAGDFQILEDGKLQQLDSVEFIRVDLNTPEAERRDPNTQAEGNRLAADPRNRVFVVYLDHYFGSLYGSHNIQRPLIDMLNRMLAPNDLFGVATALTRAQDLLLARQTKSLEDQLSKYWTWGDVARGDAGLEPEEQYLVACFGNDLPMDVVTRAREERVLDTVDRLIDHLGVMREARKVFIVYTRGWPLFRPNPGAANRFLDPTLGQIPRVGVTPAGRLSTQPAEVPGTANWTKCAQEIQRAYNLDNYRKFQDVIENARRNNVTFYPVNPNGLTGAREDVLRSLANETDGFTSFTNDLSALLKRIADDVSAYYVLGYYSSTTTFDGTFHKIEVKTTQPNVTVKARRGYFSPRISEAPAATARAASPEGFDEALGALSRLRVSAELFAFGAATSSELMIVTELANASGSWAKGAEVIVTVTDAAGASTEVRGRIDAGQRGSLLRLAKPASAGPYRAVVRATSGTDELSERLEIRPAAGGFVGAPLLFRGTPSPTAALRPVADLQFRRTERAHIEWPLLAVIDQREARLLSKDGKPLPVPITVTERDQNGTKGLAADLNLAPLAVGDYVIELTIGAGGKTERRFVAIRIRQ